MTNYTDSPIASDPGARPLFSIDGTCVELNVGSTKVWELIGLGYLEVVHLGKRCTRVKPESVARLKEFGLPIKDCEPSKAAGKSGGHHGTR